MSGVTITFRDGTRQRFEDRGRPGGSYAQRVEYQPGVVIIIDAYEKQTAFPLDLVRLVEIDAPRWS